VSKFLLDTHAVLWFLNGDERLSAPAREAILDPAHEKFVSVASAWEVAIKSSLQKLRFDGGIRQFFSDIADDGFIVLPIAPTHLEAVVALPFHHRDPFDRLLVAAAQAEGMTLISADENIRAYAVDWVW